MEHLEKNHYKKIKMISFPADGTPLPSGSCMPRAWECDSAKLAIVSPGEEKVLVDSPDQVIAFSSGTGKEGKYYPVITEMQMASGIECRNALIIAETAHTNPCHLLKTALELGAAGIIMENGDISIPEFSPATLPWFYLSGQKPFLGFLIEPEEAGKLRDMARQGTLTLFAQCDGHFIKGAIPLVTALFPGKRKEEILLAAPLPTPGDPRTSASALAGAETLAEYLPEFLANGEGEKRVLPEFSLRILAAPRPLLIPFLMDPKVQGLLVNTAGGIYLHSLPQTGKKNLFSCALSPAARPFFVNSIMEEVLANCEKRNGIDLLFCERVTKGDNRAGFYAGGLPLIHFMSSHMLKARVEKSFSFSILRQSISSVGAALVTALAPASSGSEAFLDKLAISALRHLKEAALSFQQQIREPDLYPLFAGGLEPDKLPAAFMQFHLEKELNTLVTFSSLYPAMDLTHIRQKLEIAVQDHILNLEGKLKAALRIGPPLKNSTPLLDYCSSFIPVPGESRFLPALPSRPLPELAGNIIAGSDGKKSLRTLLAEAVWETNGSITSQEIKSLVLFLDSAARKYPNSFTLLNNSPLGRKEIISVLEKVGIKRGDTILMHAALSPLGLIEGGAETVLDAILELLGPEGTLMVPIFSRPYTGFEGTHNKALDFRYFRRGDLSSVWTGVIGKTLAKRPGAITSAHATHAWAGIGAKAEKCLSPHQELDPPACNHSPLGMALREGGKILYFGCKISSSTFIHFLEDECNSIFLQNAFVGMEEEDGTRHTEVIHKHLPGHRDFYSKEPEKCKFFTKAVQKGLPIHSEKLGQGEIKMIPMEEFYRIGLELFREDPNIVLCEDPLCHFCRRFHK